jgi:hypothetical protein
MVLYCLLTGTHDLLFWWCWYIQVSGKYIYPSAWHPHSQPNLYVITVIEFLQLSEEIVTLLADLLLSCTIPWTIRNSLELRGNFHL